MSIRRAIVASHVYSLSIFAIRSYKARFPSLSGILGDCPVVRPPQWGSIKERVLQDGTLQIVYSCEPNRKLKGHKIATCTADGWDHPVPKCMPRKISPLNGPHFITKSLRVNARPNPKLEHSLVGIKSGAGSQYL